MKLSELIAYADAVKPNAFSNDIKTVWVNEVEGMIQTDVMMLAHDEIAVYAYSVEEDVTLLVDPPHDKLYRSYLCAMIDFANGEYDRYASSMQMFNRQLSEYIEWYARIYRPADGQCEWKGYYISAYGIAVKHGYAGTEEDWLISIRGETRPEGTGLEILGLIDTAEELAEVTDPETGDCYAVGTAESNTVYVWNGAAWHDIGPVKGEKGDKGEPGSTGPAGAKGDKGDRGIQGIQGPAGAAGPTGPQGSQGIQGIQGVQGQTGAQGPKGDKGEPGDRGLQGDRGPAGPKGDKGDKGDTGNISYATFEIDTGDGYLYVTYPDNYSGPEFAIADGILEVTA